MTQRGPDPLLRFVQRAKRAREEGREILGAASEAFDAVGEWAANKRDDVATRVDNALGGHNNPYGPEYRQEQARIHRELDVFLGTGPALPIARASSRGI